AAACVLRAAILLCSASHPACGSGRAARGEGDMGSCRSPRTPAREPAAALRPLALLLLVALAACSPASEPAHAMSAEWLEVDGSGNAGGTRHSIPLGEGRLGSILDLKGTLLLTGAGRPGVGFQSEVIGLVDSATGFQGRSVWTDEHGDQVFSELQGEGTAEK